MQLAKCRREFARYTSLNVMGMIGLSCYILADTYFVAAGLGTNGLAALNLAIPVYNLVHGCGLMLGMGGATRYAILKNSGGERESRGVFTHTLLTALFFMLVFILSGVFGASQIAGLLGAEGEIFTLTRTYLQVLLIGAPAFILNDILLCFVRNDSAPHLSMAAMLCGSFSNILLDYVMIFPMGLGILGAVVATVMSACISILVVSVHFLRRKNSFSLCRCRWDWHMVGTMLGCGLPSLAAELSAGVVMVVWNMILLGLEGNVAVAAYGVTANLSLVVLATYNGIAQGIQPLISRYYATGEPEKRGAIFRYAILTVAVLSGVIYLLLALGAEPVAMIFNSERDMQLQQIAVQGIRLYFIGAFFAGMNILFATNFAASDQPGPANLISLLRGFIVIIPMAFIMSRLWGMNGLWLSFAVSEGITLVAGLTVWLRARFRKR